MVILNSSEEEKLTVKERIYYYQVLKEYLLASKHQNLSFGSLSICPKINPVIRTVLNKGCGYKIYVEDCNVDGLVGIYAFTHQDKFDHVNLVVSNPNHTILLNSRVLAPIYKAVLNLNGVVYVDKASKEDRAKVKLELLRLLYSEKSITIFPESAWNLSPNKLHLPMYRGVVDIARKTGLPIIPIVQEYEYKNKDDGKEHIDYVVVRYGEPIYVKPTDDLGDKLDEVSTSFATMRFDEIQKKGVFSREQVNADYFNFVKASKRNLEAAGIDILVEEQHIFGAQDPFYQTHYLNAVDFDDDGNVLEKGNSKTIKKITN